MVSDASEAAGASARDSRGPLETDSAAGGSGAAAGETSWRAAGPTSGPAGSDRTGSGEPNQFSCAPPQQRVSSPRLGRPTQDPKAAAHGVPPPEWEPDLARAGPFEAAAAVAVAARRPAGDAWRDTAPHGSAGGDPPGAAAAAGCSPSHEMAPQSPSRRR